MDKNILIKGLQIGRLIGGMRKKREPVAFSIEWDGDTTGLTKWNEYGISFFKVSELTPPSDSLIGGTYAENYFGGGPLEYIIQEEDIVLDGDCYWLFSGKYVLIAPFDNAAVGAYTVPEKGIYFFKNANNWYATKLATP